MKGARSWLRHLKIFGTRRKVCPQEAQRQPMRVLGAGGTTAASRRDDGASGRRCTARGTEQDEGL